jgi:hypothetical protein
MCCFEIVDSRSSRWKFVVDKQGFWDQIFDQNGQITHTPKDVDAITYAPRNYQDHVWHVTARKLSHQSDVLNAMQGVFSSLSTQDVPCHQFWGVSISAIAYYQYTPVPPAVSVHDITFFAFSRGLCWLVDPSSQMAHYTATRRICFPSWSWAGWIAKVSWPNFECIGSKTPPPRFNVKRKDGTEESLTETLAARIFQNHDDFASLYTFKLRIYAEILDLTFTYFDHEGYLPIVPETLPSNIRRSRYTALATVPSGHKDKSYDCEVVWPLILTPRTGRQDALHHVLCTQVFQAVILCDAFALVALTTDGVAERVGLIPVMTWNSDELLTKHLRDYFPSSTSSIVLG